MQFLTCLWHYKKVFYLFNKNQYKTIGIALGIYSILDGRLIV